MTPKALLGWLLLALPEKTGKLAKSLNVQWLGALALLGAMSLGAAGTAWYYRQVRPEDLNRVEAKMDVMIEHQEDLVNDMGQLRRAVCRMQGTQAHVCERRVREDLENYEFELDARTVRDAVPNLLLRSRP